MRVGAHVEICGRLGSDIDIKHSANGKKYGVLSIAVSRKAGTISNLDKPLYKVNWYKAIIWDEKILSKQHALLKKGKKILLIGDLEVIPALAPEQGAHLLICVRSKSGGVSVLTEACVPDDLEETPERGDNLPSEDEQSVLSQLTLDIQPKQIKCGLPD
jgi:hypothetical protein